MSRAAHDVTPLTPLLIELDGEDAISRPFLPSQAGS